MIPVQPAWRRPVRVGTCSRRAPLAALLCWTLSCVSACDAGPAPDPGRGPTDGAALQADTRLIEQELQLAARPQIYLLVDLSERVILIKGRGLELHRLQILSWRDTGNGALTGPFRLRARPPVIRPQAAGGPDVELDPIELEDMPAAYELVFDPALTISVSPPARDGLWPWTRSRLVEGWSRAFSIGSSGPWLRLTLSREAAQSLAWTVTEGMPVLVRRPSQP